MSNRLPQRGYFVNLMNGRSGSTLLTSYLNQMPDIICYPEVLAALDGEQQKRLMQVFLEGGPIEEINHIAASDVYYPTTQLRDKDMSQMMAIGMKTKYGDVHDLQNFIEIIKNNYINVLYMVRKNILKTVLSRLRAEEFFKLYGDYNVTDKGQVIKKTMVDLDRFAAMLEMEQRFNDDLNSIVVAAKRPALQVAYEDLVQNTIPVLNQVLLFLGSRYWCMADREPGKLALMDVNSRQVGTMVTKIHKMTSDSLADAIENFDAFRERFANTRYACFL